MRVVILKYNIANPSPLFLLVFYLYGVEERLFTLYWHYLDRNFGFKHLTRVFIYIPTLAFLLDNIGLDTFLYKRNFNFLLPIYICITLIPLIKFLSSI